MKKYILLITITLVYSCGTQSEAPIDVAESMRTRACAADVEGFYAYIDKGSVDRNLKKISSEMIKNDIGDNPNALVEFEKFVIPSLIVLKWEIIASELEKGQNGSFCNMEVVNHEADPSSVNIIYPDGKSSTWSFEDQQGQLRLVSIVDEAPFDFAGLDLGLYPKPQSVGQTKEDTRVEADKLEGIESPDLPDKEQLAVSEATIDDSAQDASSNEELTQPEEKIQEVVSRPETTSSPVLLGQGYDFGSARWSMTKDQVIALQGSNPLSQSEDSLRYIGSFNGENAELIYIFSAGRLVKGRYVILGPNADEAAYLRDYESIKEQLTTQYGSPQVDQESWTNNVYKDRPDRYGFAVYIGHLSYRAKWITKGSDILLELKSNNYNMLIEAVYSPN